MYYVTARDGAAGRTAWMCGPFHTHREASAMVPAVQLAAKLHPDLRLAAASIAVQRRQKGVQRPGSLPLRMLRHPDVLALVVEPWPELRGTGLHPWERNAST